MIRSTFPLGPKLEGKITNIEYGTYAVSDVRLDGSLEKNLLKFDLLSHYPLAKMDMSLNATLHKKKVNAMLIARRAKTWPVRHALYE